MDPNTTASRLCRAAQVLCDEGQRTSTANYCISLDRGYGHVEAQSQLAEMGVYSCAVMNTNRIGLPREYLKELAQDLSDCPPDASNSRPCTHGDEEGCRRFCFTALHKQSRQSGQAGAAGSDWELSCWQDSQLIIGLTNFFSASRCGVLSRGSHGSHYSYAVWAPEGLWHYNIQGRSATDSADQRRKKLCIAERRILRAGVKGIAFVFDIAITNAAIMWQFAHRAAVSRAKLGKQFTKVSAVGVK